MEKVKVSPEEQLAAIGHSISDESFFRRLKSAGVKQRHFEEPLHGVVWREICNYHENFNKHPMLGELTSIVMNCTDRGDDKIAADMIRRSMQFTGQFGVEGLLSRLMQWLKQEIITNRIKELAQKYNEGYTDEAFSMAEEIGDEVRNVSRSMSSNSDTFLGRLRREEAERLAERGSEISFGVKALDEALGGVRKQDVVLVSGGTGSGKTTFVVNLACNNVLRGRKITLIALESEDLEIERRIKYRFLAHAHRDAGGGGKIRYSDWRRGTLYEELDQKYGKLAELKMQTLANLKVVYRQDREFGADEATEVVSNEASDPGCDGIIFDHVHYVDVDKGSNENDTQHRVVKMLRNIALVKKVPIIAVVHLRKKPPGSRKDRALVPEIDDIHGSSNLSKVATVALTLAPAYGVCAAQEAFDGARMSATYCRIAKNRADGDLVRVTPLIYFDSMVNEYRDGYSLGRLTHGDTKWEQVEQGDRYWWAQHGNVRAIVP